MQLDIHPIECTTVDRVTVTIDGTLFFSVKTPHVAVYESEDALNHLYQVAQQAFRNSVATIDFAKLNGKDNHVSKLVAVYINDKVEKKGLLCKEVIVQDVTMDQTVVSNNQTRYSLASKLEMQEQEHEYELRNAKHQAMLARIAIEASGLTSTERIEMEKAKSLGKAKFVMAADWFFANKRSNGPL